MLAVQPYRGPLEVNAIVFQEGTYCIEKTGLHTEVAEKNLLPRVSNPTIEIITAIPGYDIAIIMKALIP